MNEVKYVLNINKWHGLTEIQFPIVIFIDYFRSTYKMLFEGNIEYVKDFYIMTLFDCKPDVIYYMLKIIMQKCITGNLSP